MMARRTALAACILLLSTATPDPAPPLPHSPAGSLGPTAGHTVTQWGSKLVIIGGHTKVRTASHDSLFFLESCLLTPLHPPAGQAPCHQLAGHRAAVRHCQQHAQLSGHVGAGTLHARWP